MTTSATSPRTIGIFLFDGFELLDVCGPAQMLGVLSKFFQIKWLGPQVGPVASAIAQGDGPRLEASDAWETRERLHIVLVGGGRGTRTLVDNQRFLAAFRAHAVQAELVASVCTGSAVLAKAGLLDGKRATSNKLAFKWVTTQGPKTQWVPQARWVLDGNVITSGGVAAGMDMAVALIAHFHGEALAKRIATAVEYEWHPDPTWDPFAKAAGLV
ncbi:MAG: DJ-1/PfpI family protein [Chloroflexi bacterium]|nr:DJ-1/PfpI family protein [Chloroflexota bacterium]